MNEMILSIVVVYEGIRSEDKLEGSPVGLPDSSCEIRSIFFESGTHLASLPACLLA